MRPFSLMEESAFLCSDESQPLSAITGVPCPKPAFSNGVTRGFMSLSLAGGLLGDDKSVLVDYTVPFVAEVALARLLDPTGLRVNAGKTAEGEAVVDLLLYLAVAQTVPRTHEFHAEQHHAVVARTDGRGKALGIGCLYQGTERIPVYHGVYLVEELGFHLAPLHLQVAETQLGGLFLFHDLKIQKNQLITKAFCRSFAEVSGLRPITKRLFSFNLNMAFLNAKF